MDNNISMKTCRAKLISGALLIIILAFVNTTYAADAWVTNVASWNNITNVQQSDSFYVEARVYYNTNGAPATGVVYIDFYLSSNTVIDASDYKICTDGNQKPFPEYYDFWIRSVKLTNVPAGLYYLIAKTDASNLWSEVNENNNTNRWSSRITVSALKPDLLITNITISTANPIRILNFSMTAYGRNNGPGYATQERIHAYLSADASITTSDTLIGYNVGQPLTNGQSRALTISCELPSDISDGTYYLGAIIDPNNTIEETNEANNVKSYGQVQVIKPVPLPDLLFSAINNYSNTVTEGQKVGISITVTNSGKGIASNFYVGCYLGQYQYSLTRLSASRGPFTLSSNQSLTTTITNSYIAGDNVYGGETFVVDYSNTVSEVDDDINNKNSHPITILPGSPPQSDFIISSIDLNPSSPTSGIPFTATVTAKNQGAASGNGGLLKVWVDKSSSVTTGDNTYSGGWTVGTLTAGQSKAYTFIDLNPPAAGGPYTFRAFVDGSGLTAESDEGNNQSTLSYYVSNTTIYASYLAANEHALLSKPIIFGGLQYQVVGITAIDIQDFSALFIPAYYQQDFISLANPSLGSKASAISLFDAANPAFLVICRSNTTWSICEDELIRPWIYHLARAEVQANYRNSALTKGVYSEDPDHYVGSLDFRNFEALWFPSILVFEPSVFFDPVDQATYRQAAFEQPLKRFLTHGQLNIFSGDLIPIKENALFEEYSELVDLTINAGKVISFVTNYHLAQLPDKLVGAGESIAEVGKAWSLFQDMRDILVLDVLKVEQLKLLDYLRYQVGSVVLDQDFIDALDSFLLIQSDVQNQQLYKIGHFTYTYARDELLEKIVEAAVPQLIAKGIEAKIINPSSVVCGGTTLSGAAAMSAAFIAVKLGSDILANPKEIYSQLIVSHYAAKNAQNWEKVGNKLAQNICAASVIGEVQADAYLMLEMMEREIYGDICKNLVAATDASVAAGSAAGWASLLAPDAWQWTKGTAEAWKYAQQHWNDVVLYMVGRTRLVPYPPQEISAPSIAISSPTSSASYGTSTNTIFLGGSATDDVGVVRVTWQNNAGGSGVCAGTNSWSSGTVGLFPGTNQITISAYDAAGKAGTDTLSVVYSRPDTISPSMVISYPTSNSTHSTGFSTIDVSGIASDDVGIVSAKWSKSIGTTGTCVVSGWSIYAAGIPLAEGPNTITLTVWDATGKSGNDSIIITYSPADTQNPVVEITYPTNAPLYSTTSTNLSIGGTASDDRGLSSVQWSNDRGGSGACGGTVSWSALSIPLATGTNLIAVMATDLVGKTGTDTLSVVCSFPGAVKCDIIPQAAISAGAQWRLDSGEWQNSGAVLSGIIAGQHSIGFSDLADWTKPAATAIVVVANQTNIVSATYTAGTNGGIPNASLFYSCDQTNGVTVIDALGDNNGTIDDATKLYFTFSSDLGRYCLRKEDSTTAGLTPLRQPVSNATYTISCWAKPTVSNDAASGQFFMIDSSPEKTYRLYTSAINYQYSTSPYPNKTGNFSANGGWHHYAWVNQDNSNGTASLRMYVDGIMLYDGLLSASEYNSNVAVNQKFLVQRPLSVFYYQFIGDICNISVHNGNALSGTEIETLCKATSPVKRPTVLSDINFGVRSNRFGFNINLADGGVVVVEATGSLYGWDPLQSVTVTSSSVYFSDPQWTNFNSRFYRLRSP